VRRFVAVGSRAAPKATKNDDGVLALAMAMPEGATFLYVGYVET
jgi:hypothetical protein